MENEFECLANRRGLGGYFSEEFVKKIIRSANFVMRNTCISVYSQGLTLLIIRSWSS